MRITDISAGRSINLALATRGIEALKAIGVMGRGGALADSDVWGA